MADIVTVLRRTIENLGENTPEMRERVFEKARATIDAKLAAINPPPPPLVVERQKQALEDAIVAVRAEYDAFPEAEDEEFDSLMESLVAGTPPPGAADASKAQDRSDPRGQDDADEAPLPAAFVDQNEPSVPADPDGVDAPPAEARPVAPIRRVSRPRRRRIGGLVAAVLALVLIAGGAYALWANGDAVGRMFASAPSAPATSEEEVALADGDEPADEADITAPDDQDAGEEEQLAAVAPDAADPDKFTQRLLPDGSEIDEGPADQQRVIGEGSSIASAETSPSAGAGAQEGAGEQASAGVAVGQRAIFYEERTNTAQSSAQQGATVWSLVQEAGADGEREPAIRAEVTIPDRDLQLRMTIRRNSDETLPASHIVEMIFLTPEGFEGGGIDNVTRINMKESEQAAGNPLLGIPAKIADGFFLLALTDTPQEVQSNTTLLRRQSWIDIPLVYRSGRRALVTLEKGVPGDRVFQEALRAWAGESAG